ncbi:50S ribosomal protein L44e [Candidatus Pacearchaeota archaeon]|nr:50S ribosomal protein L44e [Candidatus Pacearchaeota archaeon]
MKIPKKIKRYCPKCKTHTETQVADAKKRTRSTARPMSRGSKSRIKGRGLGTGFGNLGKYGSKPAASKWKRTGAKTSKKTDLRYKCGVCGRTQVQAYGIRAKKLEFV